MAQTTRQKILANIKTTIEGITRIKSVLADLFNNNLDINTNLPMWTRNTCKYGDNFVYLKLDPEKGSGEDA